MSEKIPSYLEQQLEAVVSREQNVVTFTFQRKKIKLDNPLEREMLKVSDSSLRKEITLIETDIDHEDKYSKFGTLLLVNY